MRFSIPKDAGIQTVVQIKKYILFPVATAISIVLLTILVVTPSIKRIIKLRSDLSTVTDELQILEEKLSDLGSIDEERLKEQVVTLEAVIPSRKVVTDWIQSLTGLAAENDVELGGFVLRPGSIATEAATASARQANVKTESASKETAIQSKNSAVKSSGRARKVTSELESFSLSIDVKGGFSEFVSFLDGLNKMLPLVRVTSVRMSPIFNRIEGTSEIIPELSQVDTDLGLLLLYAPLPKSLPRIDEPVQAISQAEEDLYAELTGFRSYTTEFTADVLTGREDIFAPF